MKRITGLLTALAMLAVVAAPTLAQDKTKGAVQATRVIQGGQGRQVDQAKAAEQLEKAVAALAEALKALEANPEDTATIEAAVEAYQAKIVAASGARDREAIANGNLGLAELTERVIDNNLTSKVIVPAYIQGQIQKLAQVQGSVDDKVAAFDAFKADLDRFTSEEEAIKTNVLMAKNRVNSMARSLTAERTREALLGKAAPPIPATAWVNGEPLAPEDLEGKVVFVDFWAVWCGPCIATFPHLREWNEKYADKGLVIVGATKYYGYGWDASTERSTKVDGISEADEQAAMQEFAQHHNLHHRFALVPDQSFWDSYGVTGIPQAVVIDREGKIRMIKVGSGPDNAEALDELLKSLFADTGSGDE